MITFSKLPKPRPPITSRRQLLLQSSFNSSQDSGGDRDHAWPPSQAPRRPGARNTRAARRTHTPCVHGIFAVTSSREQHAYMTDRRQEKKQDELVVVDVEEEEDEEERDEAVVMMHNTMRYGSQKIRDADTRVRHVSSRINEGCAHSPSPLPPFLSFHHPRFRVFSSQEKFVAKVSVR